MQHHKQKKKPYVAPKCEVYRIGKCSLMETSAILDGFTVDDLDDDSKYGTTDTVNSQIEKEIKP